MKIYSYLIPLLFIALIMLDSCSKDYVTITPDRNKNSNFELKEQTILLKDESMNMLTNIDSVSLRFKGNNSQLDSIKKGSILLSQPVNGAPVGYLRKVVAVNKNGDNIDLITEEANLPDAFESYTWNSNTSIGTVDVFRDAMDITHDTLDTIYSFDLGKIGSLDLTFEIELRMAYQIELVTFVDYTFLNGINQASIGFDNFMLNDLSLTKRFKLGGNPLANVTSFQGLQNKLEKTVLTVALSPFPIDPPSSLVWVQPVINLKGILDVMFEAEYSNQIKLYNTIPAKGIYNYDGVTGTSSFDKQLPDNFIMEVNCGLEGTITIETGVRMEIGLAPYTRNLLTAGVGINNSLVNTLTGNFNVSFNTNGSANLTAGAEFRTDLKVAGDIFIDGDFFGFAPDVIDAQAQVFETQFNLFAFGVAIENCFSTFKGISIAAECQGSNQVNVYFDALTTQAIFIAGGTYDLVIKSDADSLVAGTNLLFGQSHSANVSSLPPGDYDVIFIYEEDCRRTTTITIPDCSSSNPNSCGPDGYEIMYNHPYCIYIDQESNKDWMASSLNYTPSNGFSCYDEIGLNCEVYGTLYDFTTVQSVCPNGWHLPSASEWQDLLENGDADTYIDNEKIIVPGGAYMLKDPGHWGQHSSVPGFNAKPSGYQDPKGNFNHLGRSAYFWTSTEGNDVDNLNGMAVIFDITTNDVIISPNLKTNKMSCRCIKN